MQISHSVKIHRSDTAGKLTLTLISLAALGATFLISNLNMTFFTKLLIFISISLSYLLCGMLISYRRKPTIDAPPETVNSKAGFNEEVEAKLFALEEAHEFFGASLKFADMFRLVANRLNEIVPFATCVLFVANEEKSILKTQFAAGENAGKFNDLRIRSGSGLAGETLRSGEAQIDANLLRDREIISAKAFENLHTGIAVPLYRNAEIFGVLVLYGTARHQFDQESRKLLEAAASRVAPLFTSAQSFENNLANALTDALTALPNERAFYLVLENQIAEAQRFRGERPLAVLAFDIVNFDEINRKFGHATGDRLLAFAAEKIKAQLRQMDFLARASGDEFFAVLPTASEQITREIIERVRKTFVLSSFAASGLEKIHLQLNYGASSFLKDGETAATLVKHAIWKKHQSKSADSESKVLFFPKEFVN